MLSYLTTLWLFVCVFVLLFLLVCVFVCWLVGSHTAFVWLVGLDSVRLIAFPPHPFPFISVAFVSWSVLLSFLSLFIVYFVGSGLLSSPLIMVTIVIITIGP